MKRLILASFLLSISFIAWARPVISVLGSRIHDCGDVSVGEVVTHEFILKNTGDDDLEIISVGKSCNCTAVEMVSSSIAPGDSTRLLVQVNTENKIGLTSVDVVLGTNTEQSEYVLKLLMNCVPSVITDDSAIVRVSDRKAGRMIRRASMKYSRSYSKDYSAKGLYTSTVSSMGRYRELFCYEGIFISRAFNQRNWRSGRVLDKNRGLWFPLSSLRSFAWDSRRDEQLPSAMMTSPHGSSRAERLKSSFDDLHRTAPFDTKRTLDVHSPLNPRKIKYFEYRDVSVDSDEVMIEFSAKEHTFPRRLRLYGTGVITLDPDTYVIKSISLTDHVDAWSIFRRTKYSEPPASFENHTLDVSFAFENGHFYTESIDLMVFWKDPSETDGADYYIHSNSRRNPNAVRLEEIMNMRFSDFRDLDRAQKKSINPYYDIGNTFYAPYRPERWNSETAPWLEWDKLYHDLSVDGCTLYDQAAGFPDLWPRDALMYNVDEMPEKISQLLDITRSFLGWIYHEDLED